MNHPPAHRLYEVRIFHPLGDFLEWQLVQEPFFAGTRLSEDCISCREDYVLPRHDHFLVSMTMDIEVPFEDNDITNLECLIKTRMFYENYRPPPPRARHVTWGDYLLKLEITNCFFPLAKSGPKFCLPKESSC